MLTQVAAFHNNLDLRTVDLSGCSRLAELRRDAFPRILSLSSLSLARTGLTTLPQEALPARLPARLDLTGTRLRCGCELAWLVTARAAGAVCSAPARLRGLALQDLGPGELGCGAGLQAGLLLAGLALLTATALSLATAAACCLCRTRVRTLAASCAVAATPAAAYKSSYDNCVYLGGLPALPAFAAGEKVGPPRELRCGEEEEESLSCGPVRPGLEATQL